MEWITYVSDVNAVHNFKLSSEHRSFSAQNWFRSGLFRHSVRVALREKNFQCKRLLWANVGATPLIEFNLDFRSRINQKPIKTTTINPLCRFRKFIFHRPPQNHRFNAIYMDFRLPQRLGGKSNWADWHKVGERSNRSIVSKAYPHLGRSWLYNISVFCGSVCVE